MNSIDAVITWVDGDDPEFIRVRNTYKKELEGQDGLQSFGLLDTRFKNIGEVEYCIRLIRKNLKFVRKIFLVTNGQVPDFIDQEFFESHGVEVVFHKSIFSGFEKYLPVFNSRSIEAMLVNIPKLSDRFLYFNDDVFVASEMTVKDFFVNDKVVACGAFRFKSKWLDRIHRFFNREFYVGTVGFRNESKCFPGFLKYFTPMHAPYFVVKSVMSKSIADSGGFENIIKYKFRNASQSWPLGLYLNEMARQERLLYKQAKNVGYFHGAKGRSFDFKLDEGMKVFSLQSLDTLSEVEAKKAILFLKRLCGLDLK